MPGGSEARAAIAGSTSPDVGSSAAASTGDTAADRLAGPVELVSLAEIQLAAGRLVGVILRTPLLRIAAASGPDHAPGGNLFLKPESLQPIGAFKLRGAYNAIASLSPDVRAAGVVSHSSGNHARGVARAARLLGVRAVIVMPRDAPAIKVRGVEDDAAEIVRVGPSSEERAARAAEIAARDGLALIPSYDDPAIIAGQGTVGIEIVEQLSETADAGADGETGAPDRSAAPGAERPTIVVPVGGGGLISGIGIAVKSLLPDARIVGVEPELAADAQQSLEQRQIVRWEPDLVSRTSADGMRTTALGRLTFAHMVRYVDAIVTVTELEIARAMARAAREARLVLEPSGATALAAALFRGNELATPPGGPVVAVLSGGNVDPDRYRAMLEEGENAGG